MINKFNEALSHFSHQFGPYVTNTKKGYFWPGKSGTGMRDQLDENGYWLELIDEQEPSVIIHDFYTFDPTLPDWAVEYVVGFVSCSILSAVMAMAIDMEPQHKAELDNWFREYTKLWKVAPPAGQNILSKDEFAAVLESFFEITLDPMVFGNLTRKDGGQWASSKEAFKHWRDSVGLNARHADIIYRAVDVVTPYT